MERLAALMHVLDRMRATRWIDGPWGWELVSLESWERKIEPTPPGPGGLLAQTRSMLYSFMMKDGLVVSLSSSLA